MEMRTEEQMEELLPIVARLCRKYTGGADTSVTYEKAQELMEAVLYCICEYEQEQAFLHALAAEGGRDPEQMYEEGYQLVVRKVKKMRAFYNRLSKNFCSYGCRNYEDVMRKGMPEFFRRYDARFAPQKTILTLDYPTLLPMDGLAGVDAIEQYLSCISLEQKFLGAFDERYVCRVFSAYDWNYKEQFFNLCGIFLKNVLGCILMGKPFPDSTTPEHLERLEQWSSEQSEEKIQDALCRILKRLVEERFQGNDLLFEYLSGMISDLAFEIKVSGSAVFSWI